MSGALYRNWDEFRVHAGRRLVQANPNGTYTGAVPEPLLAIPVLVAFGIGVAIWHRVGLGAVIGAIALVISGIAGWWLGWTDVTDMWFAIVLGALVLARHQRNVRDAWRAVRG